jgi:carbonic anhydrase/acetyltransferase-like protein (isoleucine patch superfamily)
MTESFDTSASLSVSVSSSSLKKARSDIESSLGGLTVDVNPTTAATATGGSTSRTITDGGLNSGVSNLLEESIQLASERNSILYEIRDFAERGAMSSGDGGGGGGLLGGVFTGVGIRSALGGISASALIAGGATITAGALIAGGATIVAADLIGSPATIQPTNLIAGGAAITTGSVIASGAVITPAALIAGAATISAGVLVSESATVQATALIGSAATITAGVLIGSAATIAAGALVGSAAIVKSADIIGGKIARSELLDELTKAGDTTASDGTYGNSDRTKPDIYSGPVQPGPNTLFSMFDATPPSPNSTTYTGGSDVNVSETLDNANETLDFESGNEQAAADLDFEPPDNSTATNETSTATTSSESTQSRTNRARKSRQSAEVNVSQEFNIDTRALERQLDKAIRKLESRISSLESDIDDLARRR